MSDTLALTNALHGSSVLDRLANPVVANPLAAMQSGLQVAGEAQRLTSGAIEQAHGIWGLRQDQANQAVGQAYQNAIDEQGNFDPAKFNRNLVAAGSTAALGAMAGISRAQELRGLQITQADNIRKVLSNELGPVLTLPDDQLHGGVVAAAGRLLDAGMPRQQVLDYLTHLPTDPAQLRATLDQLRLQLAGPQQVEANIPGYGQLGTATDTSGRTVGTVTNPRGQMSVPPQQGAPAGLTTAQQNEIVDIPDTRETLPDGSPNPNYGGKIPMRKGDLLRMLGYGQPGPQTSPIGSGQYPSNPALRNPPANPPPGGTPNTSAAPVPAPATAPPSTGLPPQVTAAQETAGRQGAEWFQKITDTGVAAQNQNAVLSNMLADTTNFTTGPAAGLQLKVRQWMGKFGIPVDKTATSAAEDFQKMAAQLLTQQNAGSDARMNIAAIATPHFELSPGGVDLIIRQLQGNNDYLQARKRLAATYPGRGRGDSAGFEETMGTNLDPRAFQYARLRPEQKREYLTSIGDEKEQAKVIKAYEWAENRGFLGGQ